MEIPFGYHFQPTDQQLIKSYLFKRAMGLPILPWSPILEKDLYGEKANPWDVFSDVDDARWEISQESKKNKVNRVICVFTRLSKVKTRVARRAGCGTWDGQTAKKEIYDESGKELIGFKKMFTFEVNKGSNTWSTSDHGIMHEYTLTGVLLERELKYKDYVVCKITRTCKADGMDEPARPPPGSGHPESNYDRGNSTGNWNDINLDDLEIVDNLSYDDFLATLQQQSPRPIGPNMPAHGSC
ncbi:hypothetical protein DH2020_009291 [Rehmannia glutinosa]|uniref:NAC domain-containing protein n=1 Tax=Rehmannia glutinosa TaxID=99300 RepID=A0ABR0X6R1_REHGL